MFRVSGWTLRYVSFSSKAWSLTRIQELLRTFTRLDARALRAERVHAKTEQDHRSTQAALKQVHEELDQVSRLAEIFYDLSLRLVDHMLGERGSKEDGQDRNSASTILDMVLKQVEQQESETEVGTTRESSVTTDARAAETNS